MPSGERALIDRFKAYAISCGYMVRERPEANIEYPFYGLEICIEIVRGKEEWLVYFTKRTTRGPGWYYDGAHRESIMGTIPTLTHLYRIMAYGE